MPELPDVVVYVEALETRLLGTQLEQVRLGGPSLLKTGSPPLREAHGRRVERLRRIGKRIGFGLEGDLWLVLHLMIAGRLHWREPGAKLVRKQGLAAFDFASSGEPGDDMQNQAGSLVLTEFGPKKRASLHVVQGESGLAEHDPDGLDVLATSPEAFAEALRHGNHTLKRVLTDPRVFSGIGNAYSDEILHAAGLSPLAMSRTLKDEEAERLFESARATLRLWIERLRTQTGDRFPEKVTAFRPDMAAHGKYQEPCPVCATPIQRIRYVDNETNYCPRCQTGGRILADRSLSRLLGKDFPKTIEDLELLRPRRTGSPG